MLSWQAPDLVSGSIHVNVFPLVVSWLQTYPPLTAFVSGRGSQQLSNHTRKALKPGDVSFKSSGARMHGQSPERPQNPISVGVSPSCSST